MGRGGLTWVVLAVSWLGAGLAAAQESDLEVARRAFDEARAAHEDGRFEDALEGFERAYELTREPELLYNIGTVAERLRRDRRALEAYHAYLEARPDTAERANVEGRIRLLERALVRGEAPPADAGEGEDGGEPEPAGGGGVDLSIGGWVGAAATLIFGGMSVAFWVVGDDEYGRLEERCPCTEDEIAASDVPIWDVLANAFLVAAVTAAATGVLFFVLGAVTGASSSTEVAIGPGGVVLRSAW